MIITIKAVILDKNKILVCYRDSDIILPGGRLEEGEDILECLKRELREELNLNEEDYEVLFPFTAKVYDTNYGRKLGIYYLVKLKKYNIKPANEIKKVEWKNIPDKSLPEWLKDILKDLKLTLERAHSLK